jgi:uncharacterized membrane protein
VNQHGPTVPPPNPASLNTALYRNIDALRRHHEEERRKASVHDRLADVITGFAGSFAFVYLHLAVFGFWIAANLGWIAGVPQWDRQFVILAMVASVEAIFLSTFVLISQNRMQASADRRAELDLHINLLAEREATLILTKLARIEEKLGVEVSGEEARVVDELTQETRPREVADRLEETVLAENEAQPSATAT